MNKLIYLISIVLFWLLTQPVAVAKETSGFWKNATVYFLLTDRFNNADTSNDNSFKRNDNPALLRGFEGGDIKGITQKIKQGYFTKLGVDAIWMTPVIEQVHGFDESAGRTYSYHGYWPKDWTAVDPNFGTEQDLKTMIATAHQHNIKVLIDVIINHTGPETQSDWAWPEQWIRTQPICKWNNFEQNTSCALATSLTDIKTESEQAVELPPQLLNKWRKENRLEQELAELDEFFDRTGYPRAPKYHIVKWLTDWVRDYGVDGFRVDTAKHVEADIWSIVKKESEQAFAQWKQSHPQEVMDDLPFYMVGEVFNWGVNNFSKAKGRSYDYGDKQIDFFNYGFDALINMGFASHAEQPAEQIFSSYSANLNQGPLQQVGILNYIGSHDDQDSFDRKRKRNYEAAFKLMMAPGGVQIYYGDELARPMYVKGSFGDANMRAFMNWNDLDKQPTQELLAHWQKLGQFRQNHDAVGSGLHTLLSKSPYVFKRELTGKDSVVVATGLPVGSKSITVGKTFKNGERLYDYYSGTSGTVANGKVRFDTDFSYLLLGKKEGKKAARKAG